jgi:superfamily II DNA or RNA helicase
MSTSITRVGNVLILSPVTAQLQSILDPVLHYDHRISYQGAELIRRQQMKAANPHLRINPAFEVVKRAMFTKEADRLMCPAGLKHRIVGVLNGYNQSWTFTDQRKNVLKPAEYNRLQQFKGLQFRHRQDEMLALIETSEGGVFNVPTGAGKTFTICMLAVVYPSARIAIIAPGRDLLTSIYKRLKEVVPGQVGQIGGGKCDDTKRITLCSADSLHRLRLQDQQLILYDEVHTAGTDVRMSKLCGQSTDAKFIGFSASPNLRMDGADRAIEAVFGPILMQMSYQEAAQHNMVVPIYTRFVRVLPYAGSPNIESMPSWRQKQEGFWNNDHRNHLMASATTAVQEEIGNEPQTLLMCETVAHCFQLRKFLPHYQLVYSNIEKGLKDRLTALGLYTSKDDEIETNKSQYLQQFEQGRLKNVIATQCWKQGIDPVHLRIFVRMDGGVSAINSIQLPGRLSRIQNEKLSGVLLDAWDEWCNWGLQRSIKRRSIYARTGYELEAIR